MKRDVFVISDGTGITAKNVSQSLLSQFESIEFDIATYPYTDTEKKAKRLIEAIKDCHEKSGEKPIVFATLVNPTIRELLQQSPCTIYDVFNTFIGPLEKELKTKSTHTVGRSHGLVDTESYKRRIDALNYTLEHDDGIRTRDYGDAQIILVGVSRCGKTPTSLYLAMQFGLLTANYPLTEDDLSFMHLPKVLEPHRSKLFGLTIQPERLQQIRAERKADSRYASLEQCRLEVSESLSLFKKLNIHYLDTTSHSIEEITTRIMAKLSLKKSR